MLPVETRTAIVRIDRFLKVATNLRAWSGKSVTVTLADLVQITVGETYVFFTHGWLYGRSLTLKEVARRRVDPSPAGNELPQDVLVSARNEADRPLAERVSGAEVIVAGRVTAIRSAEADDPPATVSEHAPEWYEAEIAVDEVLRGASVNSFRFIFPASQDVAWYAVPKATAGQSSVWLLRRGEHRAAPPDAYTALNALDVQSREHNIVERIRQLADVSAGPSS